MADTRHLVESTVAPIAGRDMGRPTEGGAKEEGFAFEEETQTDGWQSFKGYNRAGQMSGLRICQEDAYPLPNLRAE